MPAAPGVANVKEKLPPGASAPLSNWPPSAVEVCAIASAFVNVTLVPAATFPHEGTKRLPAESRMGPVTAVALAVVHEAGGGADEP
jgi:hypothetical protein